MESWEKKVIQDNMDKLMENTAMNDLFLRKLNFILSDSDYETLDVEKKNKGTTSSSMVLYNIAKTRLKAYGTLMKGLLETSQTGALTILIEGFIKNKAEGNVFKAYNINVTVKDSFLNVIGSLQEAVLRCSVKFQGRTVLLKHILKGLSENTINRLVSTQLKGSLLVNIINGNEPSIFVDSVPQKLKYYISRKLSTRRNISPNVFEKKCQDIFVIDGIQQIELREFAGKEGTDLSSNQIDYLSKSRFIVLELEDDFDIICDKAKNIPVHLLKHEEGQFIWVRSHGAISSLQEYVDDCQIKFGEEQFTTVCAEHAYPVCVSDTPGMGKTMLMVSLAHYIMEKYPNRLVCFFVLRDFLQQVNKLIENEIDEVFCKKIISEFASEDEFGRVVVMEFLKSETLTLDLIFDGFDEVLPDDVETAKDILRIISKLKSVTLYVSTRPHMRDELENTLGALGYNILAFRENEQIQFLTKYWEQKSLKKYNSHDEERLENFASQCLAKLKQNMNDMEGGIAGIPLQCSLLAEVYENQAVRYSNPGIKKTDQDKGMVINITSIFEMYKKLMEKRFEKIDSGKQDSEKIDKTKFEKVERETKKKKLIVAHIYQALKLLYPDYLEKFGPLLKERDSLKPQEILSLGILEKKTRDETPPKFVHRTFAEYFVGLFIVRLLTKHPDLIHHHNTDQLTFEFFLNVALRTTKSWEHFLSSSNVGVPEPIESSCFENPVVCYFINAHFKNEQRLETTEIASTRDYSKLYDVVASCITHEYPGLYDQTVHKQLLAENPQRLVSLVLIAAKYANIDLFKTVYEYVNTVVRDKNHFLMSRTPNFMITPLHVAVERGHYPITEFLYTVNEASTESQEYKYLLHCCVAGSIRDTDAALSQKLDIIKLLCRKNGSKNINECTPDGSTPLLTPNIHMKLFTSLLEAGANVNAVNSTKISPFIKALSSGKGLNIDVIRLMEEKGLKITKELASEALKGFISNKNIMVRELDETFVGVADYLIQLGGVVTCGAVENPWELESTQRNIQTIVEATDCNSNLLKQLQKRKIHVPTETNTSKELYSTLIKSSVNSFERTCVSLVSCSQPKAFLLLKACLQSGLQESLQFITPPEGLMEFVQSEKEQVVLLRSWDMELTSTRLKNTIDNDLQVVRKDDLKRNTPIANLIMYVCETASNDEVRRLFTLKQKTICVCANFTNDIDVKLYKMLVDNITWNDLAASFQNKLRLSMKVLSEIKSTSNDNFSELQNEQLAKFINDNASSGLLKQIDNYATKHLDKTRFVSNHVPNKTTLHICVEAGYYAVTEYLLNSKEYYSKLDKFPYVMHCCVAESNQDDEATISQKLKIIPLLTRINKKWVNEALPDGITPILQPNIHSKLFECLVKSGANVNVIDKDGVSPFILIMTFGKSITIQTIKMMEKNGFEITKDIASEALTGMISNRNIMAWELDQDFVLVADYLVQKGGVVSCENGTNPWELESTQKNIELIAQFTQCNQPLVQELQKRDIPLQLKKGMENSTALYKRLESFKNSFERAFISLIACNQIQPVLLLKQCIQSGNVGEHSFKFVTFPKGLINFLKEQDNNVIVMRSCDTNLTVTRLRNTVDPDINLIEQRDINNEHDLSQSNMIVYRCENPEAKELSNLEKLNRKLIIVCSNAGKKVPKNYEVIDDEICWKDLSRNFQNELDLIMRVQHEATGSASNEICYVLKNQELVSFITNQTKLSSEVFEIIENYKNENLKQNASFWLGNQIECKITPLHVAVQRGDLAISEYLLNWKNYVQSHNPEYLVHWCVRESTNQTEFVVSQKTKIIELLSNNHKRAINEQLGDGTTPILQSNVHVKLLEGLIKFGADVNAVHKHGCLLHRLGESNITPESYHDFLMLAMEHGFQQFNTSDTNQRYPLHVAVTHVDLNPETIEVFHSNGANINAFDEHGESILFYAIRSMRSIELIKTLVKFGADLTHTNHNHNGLIHICEKYGNQEAFEYLLMTHGIAPFIQGLQFGKGLLVKVINFMQEKQIDLTRTIATSALNTLICNKYIMPPDLNKHYAAALDYLIEKRGVFTCENGVSPWSLHTIQKNMHRILQATNYDAQLLQELKHRQVIPKALIGESRDLYNELKESRMNTFERLCVSLICSNQVNPFLLLKQSVQPDIQDPAVFLTPTNKMVEFLNSKDDQVIILRSFDPNLSIKRIQDTIDPDLLIIEETEELPRETDDLIIFICQNFSAKTFEELKALGRKIVCLCDITVPLLDGYESVLDEVCWEDLSTDFQDDMVSDQDNEASDDQHFSSQLKNEALVEFIRDNLPEFIGFHMEQEETLDDGLYISNDIFHYFINDKLVFQNMSENEIRKYARFGHKIGGIDDQDFNSFDYFIVDDYNQFEEICSEIEKTSPNVHLIKHHEGQFKLLTTKGSNTEIVRFIQKKRKEQQCENFPLCTCGNHPIGSGNLIWDIFRLPNSTATCWIHVPEILHQINASDSKSRQPQGLHQLTHKLKTVFQQQNHTIWWRNIDKSIPGIELKQLSLGPVDVINLLLESINNEENELTELQHVAVNTLKLTKSKIHVNNEFKKYLDLRILAYKNDTLVFAHEILAWHFIAKLVLGNSKHGDKEVIRGKVFQDCINSHTVTISFSWWGESKYSFDIPSFKFNNTRVFQFIDSIIKESGNSTIKTHLNQLSNEILVKWLFASVYGGFFHIFKTVILITLKLTQIELENLLIIAFKNAEVPLIEMVVEWVGTQTNKRVQDIELILTRDRNQHQYKFAILHVAALRGNFSVIKYLLNNHGFKNMLNNPNLLDILRFCVCDSKSSNQILVNERKRIIDFLIQLHPNLIEQTNKHTYTPLLVPNIHVSLIIRLINLGISVTSTDALSNNILHLCPTYVNPQEYDDLVRLIHTKGCTQLFHSQGEDLCTPLHKAVQHLEIQESTLELFSSASVDFNAVKDNGNTVLIYAAKHDRSARVLDALVRFGADIKITGQFKRTALHAAVEVGNLTGVSYLIYRGCDVDLLDENKSTPLHLALELSKKYTHQIMQKLITHGAAVNAINAYKRTPLAYARARKKLHEIDNQTVEFIKKLGGK